MAKRIWAASFITLLGAGAMLTSDVSARSGAMGGHHGAPPAALRAPVGKTVAHPRVHNALRGGAAHRHDARLPRNGWWGSGWYGGYYDPANYTMAHDQPVYSGLTSGPTSPYPPVYTGGPYPLPYAVPAPKIVDVIVYRPGCSSETKTIPWSDGKDRAITMVRC